MSLFLLKMSSCYKYCSSINRSLSSTRLGNPPDLEQLRRRVRRAPAEGVQLVAREELVGESKVGDLDVHLRVEQEVLRLQVAVDYLLLVAVLHRGHDLGTRRNKRFRKKTMTTMANISNMLYHTIWEREKHST